MVSLVRPRVDLKGRIVVPRGSDFAKVWRQKGRNGACILVLIDVPKLMGAQPDVHMPVTKEDIITQCEADDIRAKKPRAKCDLP